MSSFLGGGGGGSSGGRTTLTGAVNYYVTTTGSDSNPGTLAQPWATLQHAMDVISTTLDCAGFQITVNIGAGTFSGIGLKSTVGGPIIYWKGAGSASTIITTGLNDGVYNNGECVKLNFLQLDATFFFNGMTFKDGGGVSKSQFCLNFPAIASLFDPVSSISDIVFKTTVANAIFTSLGIFGGPGTQMGFNGLTIDRTGAGIFLQGEIQLESGGFLTPNGTLTLVGNPRYTGNAQSCVFLLTGPDAEVFPVFSAFNLSGAFTGPSVIASGDSVMDVEGGTGWGAVGTNILLNSGSSFVFGGLSQSPNNSVTTDDIAMVNPIAFASLPTPTFGMIAVVKDGLAANCGDGTCTTFGTTVTAGGGALKLAIWYNGTNWTLIGK